MQTRRAAWWFGKRTPDEKARDPVQGEFFATEAIKNVAEALVRESVQNSLDARRPGQKVQVEFYLCEAEGPGLDWLRSCLSGLTPHLKAQGSGINPNGVPSMRHGAIPLLIIEDTGTTGLVGDPAEWKNPDAGGAFYHFFRAEGRSPKQSGSRGRWGLGKYVFVAASRINTLIACSVREGDSTPLAMGQCTLKSHTHDGICYRPDGLFGWGGPGEITVPVTDAAELAPILATCAPSRSGKPGLSVAIPFPSDEITVAALVEAAILHYHHAILGGSLNITVRCPLRTLSLSEDTVESALDTLPEELARETRPWIALSRWAHERKLTCLPGPEITSIGPSPRWDDAFPAALAEELRDHFAKDRRVAIRVPVTITPWQRQSTDSHFHVFIEGDPTGGSHHPRYIRSSLAVPHAARSRLSGARALVVAEDEVIAGFLSDAENPAHTDFLHTSANFKGRYKYGRECIAFLKSAPSRIWAMLRGGDTPDTTVLSAFFPRPDDTETRSPGGGSRDATTAPTGPPAPAPPSGETAHWRVDPLEGGFKVHGSCPFRPLQLTVRMAYGVRRGDPLSRYHPSDFTLSGESLAVTVAGCAIAAKADNELRVRVERSIFAIEVIGFDPRRDLHVKVHSEAGVVSGVGGD